jgi:sugar O-acyltransferase (sialic acid O-acetyltransferase NeuD family)
VSRIAIYGSGGAAREVAWLLEDLCGTGREPRCYIDDDPVRQGKFVGDVPVLGFDEFCGDDTNDIEVIIAVGDCATRRKLAGRCAQAGLGFATVVHPSVRRAPSSVIGRGTIIAAGSIVSVDAVIGEHVYVNLDCTISHDVLLGDFVTLSPGVHIPGNVHVEEGVFIGTGATFVHGTESAPLVIGHDSVVAAGACVTEPVKPNTMVAGVPAVQKKKGRA